MGIEGLTRWIREKHPSAVRQISLSKLAGRRIAVDATNVCYEIWAACFRDVVRFSDVVSGEVDRFAVSDKCLNRLFDLIRRILSAEVLPVFVFDGEYPEEKRQFAHIRRKAVKDRARSRLEELEKEIQLTSPFDRGQGLLESKRKLLLQTEGPEQELETMKAALFASGIPCIQSTVEAEKLCSQLCLDGKVEAVLSSDSDNLTHGCLMLLTKILSDSENGEFSESFSLTALLESTGMKFSTFVDFCIMSGCDYNNNMKGIGIGRSYDLMKKYERIENLPETYQKKVLDTSVLNYVVCRELFAQKPSLEFVDGEMVLNPREADTETLRDMRISHWLDTLPAMLSSVSEIPNETVRTVLI